MASKKEQVKGKVKKLLLGKNEKEEDAVEETASSNNVSEQYMPDDSAFKPNSNGVLKGHFVAYKWGSQSNNLRSDYRTQPIVVHRNFTNRLDALYRSGVQGWGIQVGKKADQDRSGDQYTRRGFSVYLKKSPEASIRELQDFVAKAVQSGFPGIEVMSGGGDTTVLLDAGMRTPAGSLRLRTSGSNTDLARHPMRLLHGQPVGPKGELIIFKERDYQRLSAFRRGGGYNNEEYQFELLRPRTSQLLNFIEDFGRAPFIEELGANDRSRATHERGTTQYQKSGMGTTADEIAAGTALAFLSYKRAEEKAVEEVERLIDFGNQTGDVAAAAFENDNGDTIVPFAQSVQTTAPVITTPNNAPIAVPATSFNNLGKFLSAGFGGLKNDSQFRPLEATKELQTLLAELGYLDLASIPAEDYGYYGPRTERAVSAFQRDKRLRPVDGDAGPQTISALLIEFGVPIQQQDYAPVEPGFTYDETQDNAVQVAPPKINIDVSQFSTIADTPPYVAPATPQYPPGSVHTIDGIKYVANASGDLEKMVVAPIGSTSGSGGNATGTNWIERLKSNVGEKMTAAAGSDAVGVAIPVSVMLALAIGGIWGWRKLVKSGRRREEREMYRRMAQNRALMQEMEMMARAEGIPVDYLRGPGSRGFARTIGELERAEMQYGGRQAIGRRRGW